MNNYHQNRNAESTKYLAENSWILIHLADDRANRAFVVTSNPNHRKILLFNNIDILNKFKIFKHNQIGNFSSNFDLRKQDILSQEKFKLGIALHILAIAL